MRAELPRVLGVDDCCKAMKSAFHDKWQAKMLLMLKQKGNRHVQNILQTLEDGEFADEKGEH